MELIHVSPEQAAEWVATTRSHYLDHEKVDRFAALMQAGTWEPYPDAPPVRVGTLEGKPDLRGGNHRLRAVVKAGITVPLYVEVIATSTEESADKVAGAGG